MNTFKMQCVNYLLVNGWYQDVDGWEWARDDPYVYGGRIYRSSLGAALTTQLEWDDEGAN